jgi:hypothetical protein
MPSAFGAVYVNSEICAAGIYNADYAIVTVLIVANGADYPLALSRSPTPLVQVGLALFLGKS